jgi:hypothetical protein
MLLCSITFLPPAAFVAGFISYRVELFRIYFRAFGPLSRPCRDILRLSWLEFGLPIDWVAVNDPAQQLHPRYRQRIELVETLLVSTVGAGRAQVLLRGSMPGQVRFSNRVSVSLHRDFVADDIQSLLRVGAIIPWTFDFPLTVVNALGFVVSRVGKRRMILDPRYPNLFIRYLSFSYEKLLDLTAYAEASDFIVLTDFKSGYHQLKMHPAVYRFLGIEFEGTQYCFVALPFGIGHACQVYSQLMAEVYRPLRLAGQRMTFYIDDACFLFSDADVARSQALVIFKLFTALGFFLSVQKCMLLPTTRGKFLGLLVDLPCRKFEVPVDKCEYLLGVLTAAIREAGEGTLTPRTVAKVAGILLSIKDAVHMAPLYTRLLFQALVGRSWDDPLIGEPVTLALSDMQYWVAQVPLFEGKTWQRRSHVHFLAGDVSEEAYGGHSSLLCVGIWQPFSAAERALLQGNQISSTLRETVCALICLQSVLGAVGAHLKGDMLVYQGDNQAAIHCLRSMKGQGRILPVVKQVYELARLYDVHVDFQWLPRTSEVIQRADALSRVVDGSQIVLSTFCFQRVCQTRLTPEVIARYPAHGPIWGHPTLDVFAGPGDLEHEVSSIHAAELVTEIVNSKPAKDVYRFDTLSDSFERTGQYAIVYTMSPPRPNADALCLNSALQVQAGPAVEMVVQVGSPFQYLGCCCCLVMQQ